jgi:DNA repair protein RadC
MENDYDINPVVDDEFSDDRFRHVSMKDIDQSSRPREKLAEYGAEKLTDAELFAILIGSGSTQKNATELMTDILSDAENNLANLNRFTIEDLMMYNGIGEAKAITIKAALELSNRRLKQNMGDLTSLTTGESIFNMMRVYIQNLTHEESWALMLNNRGKMLRKVKLSEGGRTATVVDVRILCKKAILAEASSVVLVHNHPSGSLRPSKDDDNLTRAVKNALSVLDIRLLDHVIVTDNGYYSYCEMGRI